MTIIYRSVKGSNLTPTEVDNNFHDVDDRITLIEDNPPEAISVSDVELLGDQLTFILSDYTELEPVTLPTATYPWRGAWAPGETYAVRDRFLAPDGRVYEVIFAHISDPTFDAGANNGMGDDYYSIYQDVPAVVIPVGGGTGMVLTKASDADYDVLWSPAPVTPVAEITTDSFTPTADQANTYFRCTHVDGCVVSMPLDGELDFPIGTEMHFRQCTSNPVIFEESSPGPDINGIVGFLDQTQRQGAQVTIKKVAVNSWDLGGLLAEDASA